MKRLHLYGFGVAKITRCCSLFGVIETGYVLLMENNPIPDTEIPMTSSKWRKLKSQKMIIERHREKPEENEPAIGKKDPEKDR